jgi:succinate dehydrogenase / fumarate reductase flavoprotein subunit/L-aspartate oxidase
MGNSLLDLMVFGRRAGTTAALRAASIPQGTLTLNHLRRFREEGRKHGVAAGVQSPMILPQYTRKE